MKDGHYVVECDSHRSIILSGRPGSTLLVVCAMGGKDAFDL